MLGLKEQLNTDNIAFEYHICTVVFGTDDTILNLLLKDGFSFIRRSLIPAKDHLDLVFNTNAMGLRNAYETARIDNETLDVICIEKHIPLLLKEESAEEFYDTQMSKDLISLDNQIRAIRLLCECPLRCKTISFKMASEHYQYDSLFPISESVGTKEISKFHFDTDDIPRLNHQLHYITFPIKNNILNVAHRYYDLSYHQENYISITLLVVALEMIFLSNETTKREKLSK